MHKNKTNRKGIRITAIALAVLMTLAAAPSARAADSPFADVPSTHWAYNEIMEAYADGAVNGVSANAYQPNGNVTMAQFIAILTRAFHPEDVENVTSSIAYNNPGYSWYEPNYSIATDLGLFKNIPNTAPETQVTREVMAQIMYNLMAAELTREVVDNSLSSSEIQATKNKIPDFGSVGSSYGDAVVICYGLGLIAGVDNSGSFAPKGIMNRAQTAVIYVRLKQAIWEMSGAADWERENGTSTGVYPGSSTGINPGTSSANPGNDTQQPSQPTQPTQTQPTQPSTTATLTNGKPVTEENVLALIDEYKNGTRLPGEKARAAGFTSYMNGATYDAYNPPYYSVAFGKSGTECAKFALAFWDDIFGDLPVREFTGNPEDVRPGDLLQSLTHWAIAAKHAFQYEFWTGSGICTNTVDGGPGGDISWNSGNTRVDINTTIYTRYPES